MGNLEHSRNIASASKPKGIDILPLPEGARDTALIQSKISPPMESNSQNCSQFAKLSYKTTSSVRATSTDFQALAEMHPKDQSACFITTDKSKNYLAHWLPHADCSTVQLLGRKNNRVPWICLSEQALHGWNITRMWQWQQRGHEAAWDHSWELGWVSEHLVPTSAVLSGFQLGNWHQMYFLFITIWQLLVQQQHSEFG